MFAPSPLPRTLEASVRDLKSARAETRASAVVDLARHAAKDAATRARALPLLEVALKDEAAGVRSAAAIALADLEMSEALPALLVAVEDADAHVRQMALNALGEIGDSRAGARLSRAQKDSRPEVRYQAVIAFCRVTKDEADASAALLLAMGDEDPAVRHIALRVAEERLDGETSSGPRAPDADLVARAGELAAGENPHVALAAAIYLAKVGDEAARPVLLRVIRGERLGAEAPDKEDEQAAVELAGELDLREAIPHLERRVWGITRFVRDTCSFHARIALARMGHPRAKAEILDDLGKGRKDTLSAATVAAGRARLEAARPLIERLSASEVDPELVTAALARLP